MQPCPQCTAGGVFGMWPVLLPVCAVLLTWRRWPRLGPGGRVVAIALCATALGVMVAAGPFHEAHDGSARVDGFPAAADAGPGCAPAGSAPAAAPESPVIAGFDEPVVAFYLHRTARCHGCLQMEEWARRSVEEHFATEISAGLLAWRTVNVEEPAEAHYVRDFGLAGPALVLARMSQTGPEEYRRLDTAWELLDDYARLSEYIAGEVRSFLGASPATSRPLTQETGSS